MLLLDFYLEACMFEHAQGWAMNCPKQKQCPNITAPTGPTLGENSTNTAKLLLNFGKSAHRVTVYIFHSHLPCLSIFGMIMAG